MSAAHLRLVEDTGGDGPDGLTIVERWELHMRGAGRSQRTIGETLRLLAHLQRDTGKEVEAITALDVSRFMAGLPVKQNSRAAYFGHIAAFYRWVGEEGGVNITARLPRPRSAKGLPRPITDEQLRDLLAVNMRHKTRVMILLAAFAGLRVHEIAKVRGEDVDLDARTIQITGKGNVTATLPLHPLLAQAAQTMPARGWWFPGNSRRPGQPILRRAVGDIIGAAMGRAGIPNGTAHRLRHWYGSKLVADGTDLRTAQTLLRHANLNTTAIYVAVSDPRRLEAIERLQF